VKLLLVHQILIGAAIGLAVIFGGRALMLYLQAGAASDLVMAIASVLVGVGLFAYLRKVRAKWLLDRERGP
jgi:hypothetical protein